MVLQEMGRSEAFLADPVPKAIVDRGFVFRGVNRAYERATDRRADDLLGVVVFDAFPDNPEDAGADGVRRLTESFEIVLRQGRRHNMVILRYDIPDRLGERFVRKQWAPVNHPIRTGSDVLGIVHQATDVTILREDAVAVMEHYRALLASDGAASEDDERHRSMVDAFVDGVARLEELADTVTNLRRAMQSRGVIEQAKGILMAQRGIGPDNAFRILQQLSMETHVPVADVAAAVIYQLNASTE